MRPARTNEELVFFAVASGWHRESPEHALAVWVIQKRLAGKSWAELSDMHYLLHEGILPGPTHVGRIEQTHTEALAQLRRWDIEQTTLSVNRARYLHGILSAKESC